MKTYQFDAVDNNLTEFYNTIRQLAGDAQYDAGWQKNYVSKKDFAEDIAESILENMHLDDDTAYGISLTDYASLEQIAEWKNALTEELEKRI